MLEGSKGAAFSELSLYFSVLKKLLTIFAGAAFLESR